MKQIIVGNSLEKLKDLPDDSIDCIVTSPHITGFGIMAQANG
jgi:DNA modification methylase